MGSQLVEA